MECVGREWYVSGPGTVGDKGTAVPIKANKEINRTVRELGNCSTPTHTFLTSESGQAVGVKKKKKKKINSVSRCEGEKIFVTHSQEERRGEKKPYIGRAERPAAPFLPGLPLRRRAASRSIGGIFCHVLQCYATLRYTMLYPLRAPLIKRKQQEKTRQEATRPRDAGYAGPSSTPQL